MNHPDIVLNVVDNEFGLNYQNIPALAKQLLAKSPYISQFIKLKVNSQESIFVSFVSFLNEESDTIRSIPTKNLIKLCAFSMNSDQKLTLVNPAPSSIKTTEDFGIAYESLSDFYSFSNNMFLIQNDKFQLDNEYLINEPQEDEVVFLSIKDLNSYKFPLRHVRKQEMNFYVHDDSIPVDEVLSQMKVIFIQDLNVLTEQSFPTQSLTLNSISAPSEASFSSIKKRKLSNVVSFNDNNVPVKYTPSYTGQSKSSELTEGLTSVESQRSSFSLRLGSFDERLENEMEITKEKKPKKGLSSTKTVSKIIKKEKSPQKISKAEKHEAETDSNLGNIVFNRRVEGPSDVMAHFHFLHEDQASPRKRSTRGQSDPMFPSGNKPEDNCDMFKVYWPGLKEYIGWKTKWFINSKISQDPMEMYVVPDVRSHTSNIVNDLIENIEYFHGKEAWCAHAKANPAIVMEWHELWPLLQKEGWELVVNGNKPFNAGEQQSQYYVYSHTEHPEFGLHKFVSKLALTKFIARFPFLLQPDEIFIETLSKLHWSSNEDKISRSANPNTVKFLYPSGNGGGKTTWLTLKELKKKLWVHPAKLFCHSNLSEDDLTGAFRLEESLAKSMDKEPVSPQIEGLSSKERDKLIEELTKLFNENNNENEIRIREILALFGWTYETAEHWSLKWWRFEYMYLPPWAPLQISKKPAAMVPGRDYFWDFRDIGTYFFTFGYEGLFYPLRIQDQNSKKHKIIHSVPLSTDYNDSFYSLNNRIKKIVMNSTDPFRAYRLEDMLVESGWNIKTISRKGKKSKIYIPHWKSDLIITATNLDLFIEGKDYFAGQNDIIDHITTFGNQDAPTDLKESLSQSPSSKASNTSNSGEETDDDMDEQESEVEEDQDENDKEDSPKTLSRNHRESLYGIKKENMLLKKIQALGEVPKSGSFFFGQFFEYSSLEASVIFLLPDQYFPQIYGLLKKLGWKSVWGSDMGDSKIVAPWAVSLDEVEGKATNGPKANKKKKYNFNQLVENVDYFNESEKEKIMDYLLSRGFQRFVDPPQRSQDVNIDTAEAYIESYQKYQQFFEKKQQFEVQLHSIHKKRVQLKSHSKSLDMKQSKPIPSTQQAREADHNSPQSKNKPTNSIARHEKKTSWDDPSEVVEKCISKRFYPNGKPVFDREKDWNFVSIWKSLKKRLSSKVEAHRLDINNPQQVFETVRIFDGYWRFCFGDRDSPIPSPAATQISRKNKLQNFVITRIEGLKFHKLDQFIAGKDYFISLIHFLQYIHHQIILIEGADFALEIGIDASLNEFPVNSSQSSSPNTTKLKSVALTMPQVKSLDDEDQLIDENNFIRSISPLRPLYRAPDITKHIDRLCPSTQSASNSPLVDPKSLSLTKAQSNQVRKTQLKEPSKASPRQRKSYSSPQKSSSQLGTTSPINQSKGRSDSGLDLFSDLENDFDEIAPAYQFSLTQDENYGGGSFDGMHELNEFQLQASGFCEISDWEPLKVDKKTSNSIESSRTHDLSNELRALFEEEPNCDPNKVVNLITNKKFKVDRWTYEYFSNSKRFANVHDAPPTATVIYLRPRCNLKDPNILKNEDYFFSPESVRDYLKMMLGLVNEATLAKASYADGNVVIDSDKKPRTTRSGKVIKKKSPTLDTSLDVADMSHDEIDIVHRLSHPPSPYHDNSKQQSLSISSSRKRTTPQSSRSSSNSSLSPTRGQGQGSPSASREAFISSDHWLLDDGFHLSQLGIKGSGPKHWKENWAILSKQGWVKKKIIDTYYFKHASDQRCVDNPENEGSLYFRTQPQVMEYIRLKLQAEQVSDEEPYYFYQYECSRATGDQPSLSFMDVHYELSLEPSMKRTKINSDESSNNAQEKVPMTLKEAVECTLALLNRGDNMILDHSSSSSSLPKPDDIDGFVPMRKKECQSLFQFLRERLEKAQGGSIYLSGNPGQGKTLSVLTVLNMLEHERKQYLDDVDSTHQGQAEGTGKLRADQTSQEDENMGFVSVNVNGAVLSDISYIEDILARRLQTENFCLESQAALIAKPVQFKGWADRNVTDEAIIPSSQSSDTSASSTGKGRKKQKSAMGPMIILVVDEFDFVKPTIRSKLLKLTQQDESLPSSSRLILVGMGNNMALEETQTLFNLHLSFPLYEKESLKVILEKYTLGLFDKKAMDFLLLKLVQNHKGDVRAMLNYASLAIKNSLQELKNNKSIDEFEKELEQPATTPLVTFKQVKGVFSNKPNVMEIVESLGHNARNLLVALLIHESKAGEAFKFNEIVRVYNTYCAQKCLEQENALTIGKFIDELETYSCVSSNKTGSHDHSSSKSAKLYRLEVDAGMLLRSRCVSQLQKQELQNHISRTSSKL